LIISSFSPWNLIQLLIIGNVVTFEDVLTTSPSILAIVSSGSLLPLCCWVLNLKGQALVPTKINITH